MSLGFEKMKSAVLQDPRCDFDEADQKYIIQKPGEDVTYRNVTSTSFSTSSVNFSAPPPSPATIVDRRIEMRCKFRMTFTGTSLGATLLQIGANDAPRSFPLSQAINTLRISVNNISISTELSDYHNALIHYNTGRDAKEYDYSTSPAMLDQYQVYNDYLLYGSAKNCLGSYGENGYKGPRGGYPRVNVISDDGTTAVVDLEVTEMLFLNPLLWGREANEKGFIGVQTFDVVANFNNNLERYLWSHNATSGENITAVNVEILESPALLFTYITPDLLDMPNISDDIVYPYYNIDRYVDRGQAVNAGASFSRTSNNIQLNSIPKRIYIFARRKNDDKRIEHADTYARLDSISLSWNNRNGLFSGAQTEDLYLTSVRNGLNMSFDQWYKYQGSVFCIDFAKDIGMSSIEAPGLLGTYQFQYTANFTNVNDVDASVDFDVFTVVVSEGTFTIAQNRAISQIGVEKKNFCYKLQRFVVPQNINFNMAQKNHMLSPCRPCA